MKDTAGSMIFELNKSLGLEALKEAWRERLDKVEALVHTAMNDEFSNNSKTIIYHYFWIISEFVFELKQIQKAIVEFK